MMDLPLTTMFIVATLYLQTESTPLQILDGDLAEISEYPYSVSIIEDGKHICGGSIVDPKFILTTVACLGEPNATVLTETLTVRAGSSFFANGGQLLELADVHIHPDYAEIDYSNNVAILELASPLKLNANVSTIEISNDTDVKLDQVGTISGWGIIDRDHSGWVRPYQPSEQLRYTNQPIISLTACEDTYPIRYDDKTIFCAGISHKDVCVGDLGDPFVVNGIQVGIASISTLMCGELATIYVKVAVYADYIKSVILSA